MPTTTPNPAELAAECKRLADNYADWAATHAADFGYDETQAYVGTPECKRDRDALHALIDQLRDLASGPSAGAEGRAAKKLTSMGYRYQAGQWGYSGAEPERRKHLSTIISRLAELTKLETLQTRVTGDADFIERDAVMSAAQAIATAAYALLAAPAATPPAEKEVRVPLSDSQIAESCGVLPGAPSWLVAVGIARAVERAHGITGEANEQ